MSIRHTIGAAVVCACVALLAVPPVQAAESTDQDQATQQAAAKIREKIRQHIMIPCGKLDPDAMTEALVDVDLGGHVKGMKLVKSSGNRKYDEAVLKAIKDAQPLPMPGDADLAAQFTSLDIGFAPGFPGVPCENKPAKKSRSK